MRAKRLLEFKNLEYTELKVPDQVDVDTLIDRVREAGHTGEIKSVPQIFCGSEYVGGYNELRAFLT